MRVIYSRPDPDNPPLFDAGSASGWQVAAESWAAVEDLTISRWRADQRFAVGPQWYAVVWDGGEWRVDPLEE